VFSYRAALITNSSGVEAVRITWTYDPAFSAAVLVKADSDRDGRLAPAETAALPRTAQAELASVEAALQLKVNGRLIPWSENSLPTARFVGGLAGVQSGCAAVVGGFVGRSCGAGRFDGAIVFL